jgi:hypothetical protein
VRVRAGDANARGDSRIRAQPADSGPAQPVHHGFAAGVVLLSAVASTASCAVPSQPVARAPRVAVAAHDDPPPVRAIENSRSVVARDDGARPAPTWSEVFDRYLAPGTDGACGRSRACHAAEVRDAASAYGWLAQRGYIAGTDSPIASTTNSCLRRLGGNMPPRGGDNAQAAIDVRAWAAAGARND